MIAEKIVKYGPVKCINLGETVLVISNCYIMFGFYALRLRATGGGNKTRGLLL